MAAARSPDSMSIGLLADSLDLVPIVGQIRWKEWGRAPEPEDLSWWVDVTRRESGRHELPVTFVATDGLGNVGGAVGLGQFDLEELRDRSPWVLGMIVHQDRRGMGIGRQLLAHLENWASAHAYSRLWVATGLAADFYRRCGWRFVETVPRTAVDLTVVLAKDL